MIMMGMAPTKISPCMIERGDNHPNNHNEIRTLIRVTTTTATSIYMLVFRRMLTMRKYLQVNLPNTTC